MDFAGTDVVVESIMSAFGLVELGKDIFRISEKSEKKRSRKPRLLFSGSDAGHWVYFNRRGKQFNSYELHHQRSGTHQFCQSFAQIYMLADLNPEFGRQFFDELKQNQFGHNIKVVIDYWRTVLQEMSEDDLFAEWALEEFVSLDRQYIEHNKQNRRQSAKLARIAEDDQPITFALLFSKLDEIEAYVDQIAEKC